MAEPSRKNSFNAKITISNIVVILRFTLINILISGFIAWYLPPLIIVFYKHYQYFIANLVNNIITVTHIKDMPYRVEILLLITIAIISVLYYFIKLNLIKRYWNTYLYSRIITPFDNVIVIVSLFLIFIISLSGIKCLIGVLLIIYVAYKCICIVKITSHQQNRFLDDTPIENADEDLIRRKEFVDDIYESLLGIFPSEAYACGIYGNWGEGKTSVVNLLKKKIKSEQNDFIVISFYPWFYNNNDAILRAFYEELCYAVNKKYIFSSLRYKLEGLLRIINFGINVSFLSIGFTNGNGGSYIKKTQQSIERQLAEVDKRFIIVIDDIDRMLDEEIVFVLKLIKLCANFKNLIFLVLYDDAILNNKLKDYGEGFLEKFINMPILLPPLDAGDISNYLISSKVFDDIFKELGITEERIQKFHNNPQYSNEGFDSIFVNGIFALFKNMRSIKRYLNELIFDLKAVQDKVDLYDFSMLEIIKYQYPEVYKDIYLNPWYYVEPQRNIPLLMVSSFGVEVDDFQKVQTNKHIEDVLMASIKNTKYRELIRKILFSIFPYLETIADSPYRNNAARATYNEDFSDNKIRNPEKFQTYFIRGIRPSDIAPEVFEKIIDNLNGGDAKTLNDAIQSYNNEGLIDRFFNSFEKYIPNLSEDGAVILLQTILDNIELLLNINTYEGYITFIIISCISKIADNNRKIKVLKPYIRKLNTLPIIMNVYSHLFQEQSNIGIQDIETLVNKRIQELQKRNINIFKYSYFPWYLGAFTFWIKTLNKDSELIKDYLESLLNTNSNLISLCNFFNTLSPESFNFMEREYSAIFNFPELKERLSTLKNKRLSKETRSLVVKILQNL